MDFQITAVHLSKEITWSSVSECKPLFVEMMRNRVAISATAVYETVRVYEGDTMLWQSFVKDLRRYLDTNNVGLYCFKIEEQFYEGNQKRFFSGSAIGQAVDRSSGTLTVFFEDSGDYARFLKDRAVNYKLSAINTL